MYYSTSETKLTRLILPFRPNKTAAQPSTAKINITEAMMADARRRMNKLKETEVTRQQRQAEVLRKQAEQKARVAAKVKRRMAQLEAERKRKAKKPVDPAYLVNGKPYKQPKLPRPKKWADDRLYKYLWKCMEPKYGIRTRRKSEKFVLKLAEIVSVITKRKKYENYEAELNELLHTMAKLNVIKDRYDFYRFVSEYLPHEFKMKVVPTIQPGNTMNIPYYPRLLHEPILKESSRSTQDQDDSGSENSEAGSGSGSGDDSTESETE